MAHGDDGLPGGGARSPPHVVGGRPGAEGVVDAHARPELARNQLAGLPGAKQRAREHDAGRDPVVAEAPAELPRLQPSVRGEGTQLVRVPRRSLCVAHQIQLHSRGRIPASTFRYVICDVFTDTPLAGNQLGVFTNAHGIPEELLQPLARELNFAETVFVYAAAADGHARMRIFTPRSELPFAGHPVLGTAFVLAAPLQLVEIRLETGIGTVPVTLERERERIVFGRMRQPVPSVAPFERESELLGALGVERSVLPVELYDNGIPHVYVALADEAAVAALEPDLAAIARLARARPGPFVGVNCFAGSGARWKTRMFAPADGVPEDAATGSAAGPLACHLARHGRIGFGDEIEIEQGAEIGRPSRLYAAAFGSRERIETVEVGGSAVVVARGEFRLSGA